jgi:general secretion pathway protein G
LGKRHHSKSNTIFGFTLIELLVAIAIVGVMAASLFAVLNPSTQFYKANDARRKGDLKQIQTALDLYYQDNGMYPASSNNKILNISWGAAWTPYIGKLPKDPKSSKNYAYYLVPGGQSYYLYASLDRGGSDPQACNADGSVCLSAIGITGLSCGSGGAVCSYGVSSQNLDIAAGLPTSTPVPTNTPTPTSTPTGTPTPTMTPTPTPKPVQTPIKTAYGTAFSTYGTSSNTMGYEFTPTVSGKVTSLWTFSKTAESRTLKLWLSSSGALLNTVTVTSVINTWVEGVLATPTSVVAGTAYRVSTYGSNYYYKTPFSVPTTLGNITINAGGYYSVGDAFPTVLTASYLYGVPDISFIPN